jgi:hypothetical protein
MSGGSYQQVDLKRTGRPEGWTRAEDTTSMRRAWVVSRHRAIAAAILEQGVPLDRAWSMAHAICAHYVRECGWGRSEWNYGVGNIRWTEGFPKAHLLTGGDDNGPRPYRAYDSLAEGVRDAVRLARTGPVRRNGDPRGIYAPAWDFLLGGGDAVGWYDKLMRAGWHPWSQAGLDEFASIVRTVRAWTGERPPAGGAAMLAAVLAAAAVVAALVAAKV